MSKFKMGPCFDLQRGNCRRGGRYQYSHDIARSSNSVPQQPKSKSREETKVETSYRKWTYMIPMPEWSAQRRGGVNMKAFFQIGLELIHNGDPGISQQVVLKLADEGGLGIIKSMTVSADPNARKEARMVIFRDSILPFYQILSHPTILASLILETAVDTLYTFLFGPGGRRGVSIFQFTAKVLTEIMNSNNDSSDDAFRNIALSSSITVLDKLIEINQTAQIISKFSDTVETIVKCIPENALVLSGSQSLTRIQRRLNIGSTMPDAPMQPISQDPILTSFEIHQDLPGSLAHGGARHDNDHADIASIQILPTTQEIASPRTEYLPFVGSTQVHLSGLPGLLDRQFRLLREDTVGQLRDAVREEVDRLKLPKQNILARSQPRKGVRKLIYHNIRFTCLFVGRRKGLYILAEFDQLPQLKNKSLRQREEWWKTSKLLQVDSLVCFVSASGKVIFFSVCDPVLPSNEKSDSPTRAAKRPNAKDENPSLFKNAGYGTVLLSLAEWKSADVVWITNHLGAQQSTRQSLVEFPGVLLPSFQPTLQALQQMSKTLDLPFAGIIAPDSQTALPLLKPPTYAIRPGFVYNLDILAPETSLTLAPAKPFDFTKLTNGSTLDEAQQRAIIQALSSCLAMIQGPPGTGKSYTGVAIIRALLRNRTEAQLGPIICVCYTNHALDQLLEHLVKDGVKQIIRLGSRSKSETLQNLTIQHVRQGIVPTKTEKQDRWQHNQDISTILEEIMTDILPGLDQPNSFANIQAYLRKTHPRHFDQLFGSGVDENGFREVKGKKFKVVESWLRNAPKKLTTNRPVTQLFAVPLNNMSSSERSTLYKHWIKERRSQLNDELVTALETFHSSKRMLDKCHRELDLRCLQQAQIIGVTTSGLARNLELLQRVQCKVVVCEEAGEVLEAHTLTALLPGLEHAILIGDHEQLRPQINNYELQYDNPRGEKYALDISLFERLVRTKVGNNGMPLSTLKTQRRMHPSISELVRVSLYPNLQDDPIVSAYPDVDGMRNRLHWLDHQEPEDPRPPQSLSVSRTNTFEVDLVAALVSHLIRQGTYAAGEIAVITPYLGQMQVLRKRLANSFEIVVGERDQEELENKGLEDSTAPAGENQRQVQKTTLLNALRVATIDNFQGEEAKVIVVSLVRSNPQRKCGFLKTSNRINVLLSRAQHGMYIIGNADTARPVPMWDNVLSILERDNNIGPTLALCCPRHKDTIIEVSTPDDFVCLAPEGGCAEKCLLRLACGHMCPNMCHSSSLHNSVRCLVRCPRSKPGCEHECPKPCGDPCDEKCQVLVYNVTLPCGHIAERLKCHEAQFPDQVLCSVPMPAVVKPCDHDITVRCHQLPLKMDHSCSAVCGAMLACGHKCSHPCQQCNVKVDSNIVQKDHGACRTSCKRPYTTCSHICKAACHGDEPCPSCTQACQVSCCHSKCSKLCDEPCVPCAENCAWECPHRGRCPLPCAVPCDVLPCSERCANMLSCGHRCPSVCGETCPDPRYCQMCAEPKIKEMIVDFILSSTFEEIDLDESPCIIPPCGHILTLETMDGHMSMSDFYESDELGAFVGLKATSEPFSASSSKNCPTCRGPLRSLNRYSRIVRRAMIDESMKKFIVWANSTLIPLVAQMLQIEDSLRDGGTEKNADKKKASEVVSAKSITLKGSRNQQFSQISALLQNARYRPVITIRRRIASFLQQVNEREQPFGRIYELAQDARRHRGVSIDFQAGANILQVRHRLLTTVLAIKCDYTILVTFLNERKDRGQKIEVDFSGSRLECEALIEESTAKIQPATTVEGHLYWARFFALERSFAEPSEALNALLETARDHLHIAKDLSTQHPGQTAGMTAEIEDVRKMLRGDTFYLPVSNAEKAAVYAAMAKDFRGTGHWYYCVNGHPFTVGECGMPMETSRCPQCGSTIGGLDHTAVDGVARAADLDEQFGRMRL